jgi:hypothetical protein
MAHGRLVFPRKGRAAPPDSPSVVAREDGFISTIPYTFELTLHADTPRLDGRVQFHFTGQKIGRVSTNVRDGVSGFVHEQKLRFKLFPAVDSSARGVRDLPFAIAETTNRYLDGNYWTALSDGQRGVAFFKGPNRSGASTLPGGNATLGAWFRPNSNNCVTCSGPLARA